jgi:hypothetical protein
MPEKADANPPPEEEEQPSPLTEIKDKWTSKHEATNEKMKKLFTVFTENTQKQLTEQAEKHAIEIAAMKRTTMETQKLLTNKTIPTQQVNDHRASAHFTTITKACNVLFDRQLENWPTFENHLLNEAENPIGWNNKLINFQLMDNTIKPFNFLEGYFDIPDTTVDALKDDLKCTKQEDLQKPTSQLYRPYSSRTKLKNCLTPDLARDIRTSMPTIIINKDGHIFFINIVSQIFPDKEAHTCIIYEYILKLEITQ